MILPCFTRRTSFTRKLSGLLGINCIRLPFFYIQHRSWRISASLWTLWGNKSSRNKRMFRSVIKCILTFDTISDKIVFKKNFVRVDDYMCDYHQRESSRNLFLWLFLTWINKNTVNCVDSNAIVIIRFFSSPFPFSISFFRSILHINSTRRIILIHTRQWSAFLSFISIQRLIKKKERKNFTTRIRFVQGMNFEGSRKHTSCIFMYTKMNLL